MTTIASSTTKPVQIVSAISERLSRLYPNRYMMPNVPISESGTTTPGIKRGAQITQEQEHHHDHQRDRNQHRELDVVHRGADGGGAVHDDA